LPWFIVIGIVALVAVLSGGDKKKQIMVIGPKGAGKSTFAHFFSHGAYAADLAVTTTSHREEHEAGDGVKVLTVDTPGSRAGKDGKEIHREWEEMLKKLENEDLICYIVSSSCLFDSTQLSTVIDDAKWLKDHRGKRRIVQVITHLDTKPLLESQGFAQLTKITGSPIWSGNLLDQPSMEALRKIVQDLLEVK